MTLEVEINYPIEDFERILKWFSLAFKDGKQTAEDERIYNKFVILVRSLKEDQEDED